MTVCDACHCGLLPRDGDHPHAQKSCLKGSFGVLCPRRIMTIFPRSLRPQFAKRSPRLRLFSLSAPFSLIWPSRPTHLRSRRQAQLGSCTSLLHIPSSRLGHTASSLPTTQNNKTRHSVATTAGVLLLPAEPRPFQWHSPCAPSAPDNKND